MNRIDVTTGLVVLSDGDIPGLVACAFARDALLRAKPGAPVPTVAAFPTDVEEHPARLAAAKQQAESLGLQFTKLPLPGVRGVSDAEHENHELLAAAFSAAQASRATVLWSATAATGEDVDIDRLAKITDRAMIIGRLVASETETHGVPGVRVLTPFADLSFRQIAELALDLAVPLRCTWWWGSTSEDAAQARARWATVLASLGWNLAAEAPVHVVARSPTQPVRTDR